MSEKRSPWLYALRAALCVLSLLALYAPWAKESPVLAWQTVAVMALGFGVLWPVYGAWLRLTNPCRPSLLVLGLLFAAVVTLGHSYLATGTAELVRRQPLGALLSTVGCALLYTALMRLLQLILKTSRPMSRCGPSWLIGGALLLCWLPWLYFIFPGTVSNDSVTQVMEIIGVETLGNANPIFQTALIYLFRGAGVVLGSADAAVFLYCGLQALLMAWLLGCLLHDMAAGCAPRWLFGVSFIFFAVCPVFPLFAFCMGKDTNFSMAVLWLSLLTLRRLRLPQSAASGNILSLCLAGVMCTLLRNPGFYLALLTLGLLLFWTLRRRSSRQWVAPAGALASVVAVYAALHLLIIPTLHIAPMPETENLSLPLQQAARVAISHELTPQEAAALDGVLELDELPSAYHGELSDAVKLLWRTDATDAQKAEFFRVWRGFLVKHPLTCLSATFHNTYGYLYPGYMSQIKPTLLIGRQKRSAPQVEAAFGYSVNPRADTLKAFTDSLAQFTPYRILIAPGFYGWICLFAVITLLSSRQKRLLIAAAPAAFSLAGCLLSAVNGYFRYAMPLYLCAPLLLWLCCQSPSITKEGQPL